MYSHVQLENIDIARQTLGLRTPARSDNQITGKEKKRTIKNDNLRRDNKGSRVQMK